MTEILQYLASGVVGSVVTLAVAVFPISTRIARIEEAVANLTKQVDRILDQNIGGPRG